MKKGISTLLSCLALVLFLSPTLFAQQSTTDTEDKIVIIKKSSDENGTIVIDQQALETGEKFQAYFNQLELDDADGKNIKIEVFSSDDENIEISSDNMEEETIFMFKSAKSNNSEEIEKLVITLNDELLTDETKLAVVNNKKPLLGVYSEDHENGAKITGIVYNSGAQKAGIKKGDIITSMNGQKVTSSASLSEVIGQFNVGETIQVELKRGGATTQVSATLGQQRTRGQYKRSHYYNYIYDTDDDVRYNSFQDRDPCKVFIGVYTSNTRKGLKVHNLIANTPAEKSNVQVGDRIIAIDDVDVNSHRELVAQRDLHSPGDYFTLSIIRDGQQIEVDAQFQACPEINEAIVEDEIAGKEEVNQPLQTIQNTLLLEDLSVFPNPTSGPINVSFKGEAKPTTIRVTDSMGKLVYEEELKNFDGIYNNVLKLKSAAPGNLIISIQQDQQVFSQSLILMPRA